MYNATIKEQYILDNESRNLNLRQCTTVFFNNSEKMETELQKDIYDFTISEIIDFYKSLCFTSYETLLVYTSQLKMYVNYCLNRNLVKDSQNHFNELTSELIFDCINQGLMHDKIVSREDLLRILNTQCGNPSDKFLCLALFEGICGKELCDLTNLYYSDFKGNKLILSSGTEITVSNELLNYAYESSITWEYESFTESKGRNFQYDKTDKRILKRLYNATLEEHPKNLAQRTHSKLRRIRDFTEMNCFTVNGLMESGRIYNLKCFMQSENISFEEALKKHKELDDLYGKIPSYVVYLRKYSELVEG